VKARIHRPSQIALLLTAVLLLGGCALLPIGEQARLRDADPGPEIRPGAPPEYDILVAQSHQASGDLEASMAAFERALEKDPDSAYIHRKLAIGLIRSGRPAKALEHAERALELDPDDPRTRVFLGKLYRMRRNVAAAELTLTDESGEPINQEAGALLYQVYLESDRGERAVDIALWMIEVADDPIKAHLALAKAYERTGEFDKPMELCARPSKSSRTICRSIRSSRGLREIEGKRTPNERSTAKSSTCTPITTRP